MPNTFPLKEESMATQVRNRTKTQPTQSYSVEQRQKIVATLKSGQYTRGQVADAYNVSMGSLRNWEEKYGQPGMTLPSAPPLPTRHARTTRGNGVKTANGAKDGAALQMIDHAITALQQARPILAQFANLQAVAQQILAQQ
jgi:transposase-like protein